MKELDFEKVDGFVRDLTTYDETLDLYCEVFDEDYNWAKEHCNIEFMRNELVAFYTSTYACVFVKAPNVYQIVEEDLFTKGEN